MRKFILAISALLLTSGAQANVSPVQFPDIGSLRDGRSGRHSSCRRPICRRRSRKYSATFTGVASANTPCVSSGATCNGDAQTVTRTATLANGAGGNKYLNVTVNTFNSSTDVGKTINVPGVSFAAGSRSYTTIASVTDAQNVVLTDSASGTFSATSKAVSFGTDDADSFMAFNTWARANRGSSQVVLTIPNG